MLISVLFQSTEYIEPFRNIPDAPDGNPLLTCSRSLVVEELQADPTPRIPAALKIQKDLGSDWHCEDC